MVPFLIGADGVVRKGAKPPFVFIGKPPRPRSQRRLRNNFLIARPPLLAVMQGGELPYSNFFTAS
ncbi:MAG: hypothetical protein DMG13_09075 [Acidobacteria bacterium]|nr:MAG: hypothetical protein DMG13_09075 [Acidobacteriota bacterium]